MPPKVSAKRQKEMAALAEKKKARDEAKAKRDAAKEAAPEKEPEEAEEAEGEEQPKPKPKPKESKQKPEKNDDYRTATGVLESRAGALDVKIGGFSLAAFGKQLISDTTIEFSLGRRYGLIGANGSGKTTFLKCLAAREVPIPPHIDLFLLQEEAAPTDMTALQMVLADARSEIKRLDALLTKYMEMKGEDDSEELDIMIQDVSDRLEELDPNTMEERAGKLLYGLGFDKKMGAKATKDMSGGWRMRVALARALFLRPALLLLDEPTNHLDLESCVWLEEYLATYNRCLIVTSHSQDFLNRVCTDVIHITHKGKLVNYTGNYDQFIKTKQENEVNQLKQYKKEQEDIKHIKAFIASCGTYANLVRQAKSKQKILDKMYEKGLTEMPHEPPRWSFKFNECESLAGNILVFEKLAFSYSGKKEDYLYTGLDLGVNLDSRIALVGPNGCGKSTLLKLMCGDLAPTEGAVRRHLHLDIGRFHQHSVDALNPEESCLEFFQRTYADKKWEEAAWRAHIGRYGVTGKYQTAKIRTLSDGLKSRLIFAMIGLKRANLLLLDEPTNHLDIETIDSLADAINAYNGGVVLVSHDFRLINQVAKVLWVCDKKTVKPYPGDIRVYKKRLIEQMSKDNRW